jgi:mannose-1-phosphate guanylyltransferase
MEHFYALIMAGGGGTRLWPMSRTESPKQMLPLVEDQSMFAVSVERLAPLFPPERIYIVTGQKYAEAMHKQTPQIPFENFIVEPYGKDSGPAAALGIAVIQQRDPQATVAILTADHHITYKDTFRNVLGAACELAQDGGIVTLGISPSFPSTAFGYIRRGEPIRQINGFHTYESMGFTEKPDQKRAETFLKTGEYSWNSGMFILRAQTAMDEFCRQQPDMFALFQELAPTVDTAQYESKLAHIWEKMRKISLDYAIMEGAPRVAVIPVDIGWSDVGSWDSLFDILAQDDGGNCVKGQELDCLMIDTKNTLVYGEKLVVTVGLQDLVIVDTGDVLMICHKERTQDVKNIVNKLKADNKHRYL